MIYRWTKVGNNLSDNQCDELKQLSQIGENTIGDIDSIEDATLYLINKKEKHKEINKINKMLLQTGYFSVKQLHQTLKDIINEIRNMSDEENCGHVTQLSREELNQIGEESFKKYKK